MNNWTPPAKLTTNGDFETGCLQPWHAAHQDPYLVGTDINGVTKCSTAGDCIDGNYYYQISTNVLPSFPTDAYVALVENRPHVTDTAKYKFTVRLKGVVGSYMINYPYLDTEPLYRGNATGQWEKVELTLSGRPAQYFQIAFKTPSTLLDWKVDGFTVVSTLR